MYSPRTKYFVIGAVVIIAVGAALYFWMRPKTPILIQPPIVEVELVRHEVIGKSVQGRDIEAYTYGTGPKNIVFVGGIHGGYEWNSVMLAYQLVDYFDQNISTVPSNVTMTIIPVLNPDGVFRVTGKDGRFTLSDVSKDKTILASGRFNANDVDLNRNFDCNWQAKSTWQSKTVSAGTKVFSEPESQVFKKFVEKINPDAVIFWHSQANSLYASSCGSILPETKSIMNTYAKASGYPAADTFDSYAVTGDAGDWLAKIGIPAFEVELKTHESIEFSQNLAGVKSMLGYFDNR